MLDYYPDKMFDSKNVMTYNKHEKLEKLVGKFVILIDGSTVLIVTFDKNWYPDECFLGIENDGTEHMFGDAYIHAVCP